MPRSPITTHVLDTARGCPASGVEAELEAAVDADWRPLGTGTTDDDGRIGDLLPTGCSLSPGIYRLTFDVAAYQNRHDEPGFYPKIPVIFEVKDPTQHYHVPLLLSPFGYSTYRGS